MSSFLSRYTYTVMRWATRREEGRGAAISYGGRMYIVKTMAG